MADRIGSLESFGGVDISMIGPAGVGQPSYVANTAWLTITVSDKDRAKVNRERFSNVLLSSAFSALPGCYFTNAAAAGEADRDTVALSCAQAAGVAGAP